MPRRYNTGLDSDMPHYVEEPQPDENHQAAHEYLDHISAEFDYARAPYTAYPFNDWLKYVRDHAYALPRPIYDIVEAELQSALQSMIEDAERRAGWDPNP